MIHLLIVSDTHRRTAEVIELYRKHPHDVLIHLGDLVDDARRLERALHIPVTYVRGNNDPQEDVPWERVVEYCGVRLLLTHGHRQSVGSGRERLARRAKEKACRIALFGHTHRRADEEIGSVRVINPGAVYRSLDRSPSVLSMGIDEKGHVETEILYL